MLPLDKITLLKLLEIANRISFFERFSISERTVVLDGKSRCYLCKDHQHIQRQGTLDTNFYLVLSGNVDIVDETKDEVLGLVKPGEFIGEGSFITNSPRSASAKANGDVIVLCLSQSVVSKLPYSIREKIKDAIIAGMAKRIVSLNEKTYRIKTGKID